MSTATECLPITELLSPNAFPHACDKVELVETHISWVLLTGSRAYKIKKPVNLGFVDFTDVDRRRRFCEEEVRLNARTASDVYLGVSPVTSSERGLQIAGDGEIVDYAVCMRQFDPDSVLSDLSLSEIAGDQIDSLADELADFHRSCDVAAAASEFGLPDQIWSAVQENFEVLRECGFVDVDVLNDLQQKALRRFDSLRSAFTDRKQNGHIRECHGDLHLGNMFLEEGRVRIFDGIEFNDSLRWIDVASDLAFLVMDLEDHDQHRLGGRLLNRWLERTGDYEALAVLPFYCSYRAAVRAKVAAIRKQQTDETTTDERDSLRSQCQHYLELAGRYLRETTPTLTITMGPSGSGKTTATKDLVETGDAIRIRSDVERKRIFGLAIEDRSTAEQKKQMYSPTQSVAVYVRLRALAGTILQAGFSVVVDATFLRRVQRETFRSLAHLHRVGFSILYCRASQSELRRRIRERDESGKDASEAAESVLDTQLRIIEEPRGEELRYVTFYPPTQNEEAR